MAFGCAVARLGESPQAMVRDSQLKGLGAGPITTVHPVACPWGFNTANRQPTFLERAEHTLCLMAQDVSNAAGDIGTRARNWWHSLWGNVQSAFQSAIHGLSNFAQTLWNGVKSLWNWFYNAFKDIVGGIGLFTLLMVGGAIYFISKESKSGYPVTRAATKYMAAA